MTSKNPLYNEKQITDSSLDENWEMDRWEDDGGKSMETTNHTHLFQKCIDDL